MFEIRLQIFGMHYFQSKSLPEVYENTYITRKTYEMGIFVFLHRADFSTF